MQASNAAFGERKAQRIADRVGDVVAAVPLGLRRRHHRRREIEPDDEADIGVGQGDGQIAGAGGDVEHPVRSGREGVANGDPAPAPVLTERHQTVHQVVAADDPAEHPPDLGVGFDGAGQGPSPHR